MTRQTKTPRQRAEEALNVADRKVTRLKATVGRLEVDLKTAKADLLAEQRRRNYLAQSPDLPQPSETQPDHA